MKHVQAIESASKSLNLVLNVLQGIHSFSFQSFCKILYKVQSGKKLLYPFHYGRMEQKALNDLVNVGSKDQHFCMQLRNYSLLVFPDLPYI